MRLVSIKTIDQKGNTLHTAVHINPAHIREIREVKLMKIATGVKDRDLIDQLETAIEISFIDGTKHITQTSINAFSKLIKD